LAREAERVEIRRRRAHTLRVHMDATPSHLNPMVKPSVWGLRVASDTIFETLIRYIPPEGGAGSGPGHYEPGLAKSWRVSGSGREIVLELQDGITFHDGKPLSSVDVQWTLDTARHPRSKAKHLVPQLADIMAVELITNRSVRIRLKRPNGFVLRALADVHILPAHVYERRLSTKKSQSIVGTGPYELASWEGDVIHLKSYDGYWGDKPSIKDIEFVYEPDAAIALTSAKRGDIDIVPALIPAHYPEQASAPGFSSFAALRLRPPSLRYIAMDNANPPFDDARVRKAVALLIDRKNIIKRIHGGLARAAPGPIWPGGPGDGAAQSAPEYDTAAAAKLLDEAGWRDSDGDGVREKGSSRFVISLLALESKDDERSEILKSLRKAGIIATTRPGSAAVLLNRLRKGEFDLALVEWRGTVDRDLGMLLRTGGKMNFGRYSNAEVDKLVDEARGIWEPSSRAPLSSQIAKALGDDYPIAPITSPDPYGLVNQRVQGVVVWNGWISLRGLSLADVTQ
jgi:peptide/nickel transport system substrate-binding protein